MDDDGAILGCCGIIFLIFCIGSAGAGIHHAFHTCPTPSDKLEADVPVSHPAPTGVEIEWSKMKSNWNTGYSWAIIKDHDRNLQWRIVYIGDTITILPGSEQPITTQEKTKP